eukprot:gene4151-4704_t
MSWLVPKKICQLLATARTCAGEHQGRNLVAPVRPPVKCVKSLDVDVPTTHLEVNLDSQLIIEFLGKLSKDELKMLLPGFADRVRNIAQHAINNINQLAGLVDQSSIRTASNNEAELEQAATRRESRPTTPTASTSIRPSPNHSSGQASAVSELRQRFPTVNRGSRRRDQRPAAYSRATSARSGPGRPPLSEIITRVVIILEMACEKVPTKTERQALERTRRIISGFDFDKRGMTINFIKNCKIYYRRNLKVLTLKLSKILEVYW